MDMHVRKNLLWIVQKQDELNRRSDLAYKSARQFVADAVKVAYVKAKEAGKDPRAIALASAGALVAATAWVAYATHNPVTEQELQTALGLVYMPRRAARIARRFGDAGHVSLREYIGEAGRCKVCYELFEHLLDGGEYVQLQLLGRWLSFVDVEYAAIATIAEGTKAKIKELRAWTEGTLLHWMDDTAMNRLLSGVASRVEALDVKNVNTKNVLFREVKGYIEKVQDLSHKVTADWLLNEKAFRSLDAEGAMQRAVDKPDARRLVLEYIKEGVRVRRVDRFLGTDLLELVEGSIKTLALFPPRRIAHHMAPGPYAGKLALSDSLAIDETEPCVQTSGRLPAAVFSTLKPGDLVAWAIANVRTVCVRGYDDEAQMRHLVGTLSRLVRDHCGVLDYGTVDDAVYLALAMRVVGHHASAQFESAREDVLGVVFAAVVHVAKRVADFALTVLPSLRGDVHANVQRDLNLFHEPQHCRDGQTIADYGALCDALYEGGLLAYVAPGIEPDASGAPKFKHLVRNGVSRDKRNMHGGWGFQGHYWHKVPEAAQLDGARRPPHAPYYLGGARVWGVARAAATLQYVKTGLKALVPTSPAGVAAVVVAALVSTVKRALVVMIIAKLALGAWGRRELAYTMFADSGLVHQSEFVEAVFACTPFRALNVICAALTAQETPASSRSSVARMLDGSGYVRIALDAGSAYAGIDVAPPEYELHLQGGYDSGGLFTKERIMMHFSRGHFADGTGRGGESYSTERVVGTPGSVKDYVRRQGECDRAIAQGQKIQLSVSLAARQYAKAVPAAWLEEAPEAAPWTLEAGKYLYYVPETGGKLGVIRAREENGQLTVRHGGLDARVQWPGTKQLRLDHDGWACILNPASAIRIKSAKPASTSESMLVRILVCFDCARMRSDIVFWAKDRGLMLTVVAAEGTLRFEFDAAKCTVKIGGSAYTVRAEYSAWSSLFSDADAAGGVQIEVERNGSSFVVCLRREDGALHAYVVNLLHSRNGLSAVQTVSARTLLEITRAYENSACWLFVSHLHAVLNGDEAPASRADHVKHERDETIGASRKAAQAALDAAGTDVEKVLARSDVLRLGRENVDEASVRFEAATGLVVSEEQLEVVARAQASCADHGASVVIPLVMGAGKSAVIIPMLVLRELAGAVTRVIVVVPKHLVDPTYLTLATVLSKLGGVRLYRDTVESGVWGKAVCVLSAHKMQQVVMEGMMRGGSVFYTNAFAEHTTMIFDEFDGLMDPLECEFRQASGKRMRHYVKFKTPIDAYYRAVIDVVRGHVPAGMKCAPEGDRDLLIVRLTTLNEELGAAKERRRDFGLRRGGSVAVPFVLGRASDDMHFSDIDGCAILTARLFIAGKYDDVDTLYDASHLRPYERDLVRDLVRDGTEPQDACAMVAMRGLHVYESEDVIPFCDIAFMCLRRVAFSGTVEVPCKLPLGSVNLFGTELGWAPLATGGEDPCDNPAKRAFRRVLARAENAVHTIADDAGAKGAALAKVQELVEGGARCVIDACGIFAGESAADVSARLRGALTPVYMDEEGRLHGSCASECLYYFNQQSSRGVDLKMKGKLSGVVIMRKGYTTLTAAAQAAFRMRLVALPLNGGFVHSIVFVAIGSDKTGAAAIVEELVATEAQRAAQREPLHDTHLGLFAGRIAAYTSRTSPSYRKALQKDTILGADTGSAGATATATATAMSLSVSDEKQILLSTWYNREPDDTWLGHVHNLMGPAFDYLGFFRKTELYQRLVTGNEILPDQRVHCVESSDDYDRSAGAMLHEVKAAGSNVRVNMRYVAHLAQSGGFYRDTIAPVGVSPGDYEAIDSDEFMSRYLEEGATAEPSKCTKLEPPANVLLYATMGSVEDIWLRDAIAHMAVYGEFVVRITNRMFLEHARIDRAYCVVIAHKRGYVLGTCADLLLSDIRKLEGALVYVQSETGFDVKTLDMEDAHAAEDGVAMYLLACVGAVLDETQQAAAIKVNARASSGLLPHAVNVNWHHVRSARPSDENTALLLAVLRRTPANTSKEGVKKYMSDERSWWVSSFGKRRKFV